MKKDQKIINKIKVLKGIKKSCPIKTQTRRSLNKEIRELKTQLKELYNLTPEKKAIIEKIYFEEPHMKEIKMNLAKFTIEELTKHYNKIINNPKTRLFKKR